MTGIRVTYSGLIAFGINLISVVTGLVFTLIVTRNLSVAEFGTWGLVNGIIVYALIISPIITYWVTREVARGETTSKTAVYSSTLLSVIGVVIYLIAAFILAAQSDADLSILIFATILVPIAFIEASLTAINLGHNPQASSFGFLAFEIAKIPTAFIFVDLFNFGVEGAIFATFVAYSVKSGIQAFYARNQLRSKFQKKYLVKWLKLFWMPTYRTLPSMLALSDVAIFSIITGSVEGVAYYTSARTLGLLVNHTRAFAKGVYPKLLESEKRSILQENLIKLLYLAFPLLAFSITFAKPGLYALNPIYQVAAPFVIFISIRTFLTTLNGLLFQALLGIESIDKDGRSASFRDYAKSTLTWIPTVQLIRQVAYVGILASLLLVFSSQTDSTLDLVFYWVTISLVIEIPVTIYTIHLTKRSFTLKIDKISLFKYLLVCIGVFGLTGLVMEENLEYKNNIFEFLPVITSYAIIALLGYLAITYLIDQRTKFLVNAIWKELTSKRKQ